MKAKSSEFAKIISRRDPLRLYLFHGVDDAGSRGLGERLANALGGERVRLDPSALRTDPGRLVDEAAGAGLFADTKLLWVEPVGNEFEGAADALLGAPTIEFPVVAIAGALTRGSKLLKRVEADERAIAVVSYAPDQRDMVREINAMIEAADLHAEEGVAGRLAMASDLNRDIAQREIEKLTVFLGSERQLTHEAIDAVGADYGDTEWLAVGDAAMQGDIDAVEAALSALSPQAAEATTLLRALQRRIQMLAPLSARVAAGESAQAVLASMGRVLFWKDKPVVARLLSLWPADKLARLADRVARAERAAMLEPGARRAMLGEELLAIARVANRRR
ncbi:DNA polymerase III subunit delta [Sphingomicrobium sp. XHP0239]|uniref:DNA polymerase III subunit delta n=1 Tax=Sphingomicrobium maritimum TaxID=3133972 RepID=UPI0031CC6704